MYDMIRCTDTSYETIEYEYACMYITDMSSTWLNPNDLRIPKP